MVRNISPLILTLGLFVTARIALADPPPAPFLSVSVYADEVEYRFALLTGSTVSVVSEKIAMTHGDHFTDIEQGAVLETELAWPSDKSIEIFRVPWTKSTISDELGGDIYAILMPQSDLRLEGFDGALDCRMLYNGPVDIVSGSTVRAASHASITPPVATMHISLDRFGRPYTCEAKTGGVTNFFLINTGFLGGIGLQSLLFNGLVERGDIELVEEAEFFVSGEGTVTKRIGKLRSFQFGPLHFEGVPVSEDRVNSIGLEFLAHLDVTIDFQEQSLLINRIEPEWKFRETPFKVTLEAAGGRSSDSAQPNGLGGRADPQKGAG